MSHRDHLPQLNGELFLTDGGIETTLIFHEGIELPLFAAFDLLKDDEGTEALRRYYEPYAKLARRLDHTDAEEVVLFEEWRTPDDLWAWTGGRINVPRLLPGTEELIENLTISHYEALDVEPYESVLEELEHRTPEPPPQP